jgi:hypothetical protein
MWGRWREERKALKSLRILKRHRFYSGRQGNKQEKAFRNL